jgi:hypothetical protein
MRDKIKSWATAAPTVYVKPLPEPVFGQIKQAGGFRQFLMRASRTMASRMDWNFVGAVGTMKVR